MILNPSQHAAIGEGDLRAEVTADLVDVVAEPECIGGRRTIETDVPNLQRRHLQREELRRLQELHSQRQQQE